MIDDNLKCPKCSRDIKPTNKFCPGCGCKLQPVEPAQNTDAFAPVPSPTPVPTPVPSPIPAPIPPIQQPVEKQEAFNTEAAEQVTAQSPFMNIPTTPEETETESDFLVEKTVGPESLEAVLKSPFNEIPTEENNFTQPENQQTEEIVPSEMNFSNPNPAQQASQASNPFAPVTQQKSNIPQRKKPQADPHEKRDFTDIFKQVETEDKPEEVSIFANGLPEWSITPPNIAIFKRSNKK